MRFYLLSPTLEGQADPARPPHHSPEGDTTSQHGSSFPLPCAMDEGPSGARSGPKHLISNIWSCWLSNGLNQPFFRSPKVGIIPMDPHSCHVHETWSPQALHTTFPLALPFLVPQHKIILILETPFFPSCQAFLCLSHYIEHGPGAMAGPGLCPTHASRRIFLRATSCPVHLLRALYTTP